MNKRTLEKIKTRNKIYNAAVKLIIDEGYNNININQICSEAGVSVGAFYHHFKSKGDIIVELYLNADKNMSEKIKKINWDNSKVIENILTIFKIQLEEAMQDGVSLMTELYKYQVTDTNDFLYSQERAMPTILKRFIEKGQENNIFTSSFSSEFISNELMKYSRGLMYDWCLHKGSYNLAKNGLESIEILLKGFYK